MITHNIHVWNADLSLPAPENGETVKRFHLGFLADFVFILIWNWIVELNTANHHTFARLDGKITFQNEYIFFGVRSNRDFWKINRGDTRMEIINVMNYLSGILLAYFTENLERNIDRNTNRTNHVLRQNQKIKFVSKSCCTEIYYYFLAIIWNSSRNFRHLFLNFFKDTLTEIDIDIDLKVFLTLISIDQNQFYLVFTVDFMSAIGWIFSLSL